MTKLDSLIVQARNARVARVVAERHVRDLERTMTERSTSGETMGSYQIVRKIGEGGMGVVHLGMHSILGRPAAIKVLRPGLSLSRDILGRFFNEARAAAAIRHPGIVDIYDFGFLPDGSGYIAMEFLEGETLGSRLRRMRRLPVGASIEIGRQIAAALHAAHGKDITHRDLKPDNVFLVQDPEIGERVKLLDFGIAKLAANDTGGAQTRTGMVMGTPMYMSPEQCRGARTLDCRSDLYSLGCILYELLAGRPVFHGDSANDIVAHHMYFQPEPVRSHEPSVPESLDQLIQLLLSKDPAMRPATAGEVATLLERCGTAGAIAPPTNGEPFAGMVLGATRSRERQDSHVSTTLTEAAGAVGGRTAGLPAPRRSRRSLWFAGSAALAAAAGIAIAAHWYPDPQARDLAGGARVPATTVSPGSETSVYTPAIQPPPPAVPPDAALPSTGEPPTPPRVDVPAAAASPPAPPPPAATKPKKATTRAGSAPAPASAPALPPATTDQLILEKRK